MKEKRHLSEKTAEKTSRAKPAGRFRLLVQAAWFAVTNGYAAGFLEKRIYTGKLKRLCGGLTAIPVRERLQAAPSALCRLCSPAVSLRSPAMYWDF